MTPPEVSFADREWRRVRYIMARGRSRVRRWQRRVEAAMIRSSNGEDSGD